MSLNRSFIPLSVPNLCGNELRYVRECIETGWVSSVGSYVEGFEEKFARYIGTKYAVAAMNGTAALHISLLLCGVEPGDEVLVPNLSFVAPANAVRYCGAEPLFMDSEPETLGMDPGKVRDFFLKECRMEKNHAHSKKTGARVKAIIPMHTLGHPVNMDPIMEICRKYRVEVIEDATESLGSEYRGTKTGNFGKLACFSFNGNKIITTGGGGMITTNDQKLARRAKHLTTTAKADPIEYYHDAVGYNYRLVNVLAAIGVAQLEMIEKFIESKRNNFLHYRKLLKDSPHFYLHEEASYCRSNYWMYALIKKEGCPYTVPQLVKKFEKERIQVRPLWTPLNTLPMYRKCRSYHCDFSARIYHSALNLPCSTNLSKEEIERVVDVLAADGEHPDHTAPGH